MATATPATVDVVTSARKPKPNEQQTRVRPVPTSCAVIRFRLCKFHLKCPRGDRCTNPHSEEEMRAWNHEKRNQGEKFNNHIIYAYLQKMVLLQC